MPSRLALPIALFALQLEAVSGSGCCRPQVSDLPARLRTSDFDAVVVLGGGGVSSINNISSFLPWTRLRLLAGAAVFHGLSGNPVMIPSSCSTPHASELLDVRGRHLPEAHAATLFLAHRCGVPPTRIYPQPYALDTIVDVLMPRLIHFEVRDWNSVLFVTSAFHAERTRAIIDWVFSLPRKASRDTSPQERVFEALQSEKTVIPAVVHAAHEDCRTAAESVDDFHEGPWEGIEGAPSCSVDAVDGSCEYSAPSQCGVEDGVETFSILVGESVHYKRSGFDVTLVVTPDASEDDDASLQVRRRKEADALSKLKKTIREVNAQSLADLHEWVYSQHGAYAAAKIGQMHYSRSSAASELRDSYVAHAAKDRGQQGG